MDRVQAEKISLTTDVWLAHYGLKGPLPVLYCSIHIMYQEKKEVGTCDCLTPNCTTYHMNKKYYLAVWSIYSIRIQHSSPRLNKMSGVKSEFLYCENMLSQEMECGRKCGLVGTPVKEKAKGP